MHNIDKTPRDENHKKHGEWIRYYSNDQLAYHVNYIHGFPHGLYESYDKDGILNYNGYFNMGKKVGYWNWGNKKQYYLWLI